MIWGITYFGIISLIVSIGVGVGLSAYLFILDRRIRKREEMHYKKLIGYNISSIKDIFKQLSEKIISDPDDASTEKIERYFENNEKWICKLISDTSMYITQWKDIDVKDKSNLENMVKSLDWLITEYCPSHLPSQARRIRCRNEYNNFHSRKDTVMTITSKLKNKYKF